MFNTAIRRSNSYPCFSEETGCTDITQKEEQKSIHRVSNDYFDFHLRDKPSNRLG